MDARQIQQIILNKTFTKTDYLRRVTYIREYLESRFYKNYEKDFFDFLRENKAPQHDHEALSLLDGQFFNLFTKDNLYPIVNTLNESLKALPLLTVYLAVIINDYLIDEIGIWFRKNLHPELIMEVRLNPTLVAGAAYVWNNKYYDLSLHNFFKEKEKIITQIISDYAKRQI